MTKHIISIGGGGFGRSIGDLKIEAKLNTLAKNPKAQETLRIMYADINAGKRGDYDAMDYWHNMKIDAIFQEARRKAWASIMNDPRIQKLKEDNLAKKVAKQAKKTQTRDILSIYK